jgi:hypothetical protein
MAMDENADQEHVLRSSQTEIATLRQELDTIKKIKDGAIQENRRLQDDLCSVTCDCRDSRKELELYKRQVDDLKTQLQHYVAEVKRTEDLISNKVNEMRVIGSVLLKWFCRRSREASCWISSGLSVTKRTFWKRTTTLWKTRRRRAGYSCRWRWITLQIWRENWTTKTASYAATKSK